LGPQFVGSALAPDFPALEIAFIDNTDPKGIDRTLAHLPLATTLVIVTSKSGGTPEARNGMLEVRNAYEKQDLDFPQHAVAVTMPGSQLDKYAQDWLTRFPMRIGSVVVHQNYPPSVFSRPLCRVLTLMKC